MENTKTVVEILKENDIKPGFKLYSSIIGECTLKDYIDSHISVESELGFEYVFDKYGRLSSKGECLLFPSKENRDWDKFINKDKLKFSLGDKIRHKISHKEYTIKGIEINHYKIGTPFILYFKDEEEFELVSNKFDISTLKTFDKVLVRYSYKQRWTVNIFGYYAYNSSHPFICSGNCDDIGFNQCIPYEGNEHLLGTTNDCDEYYKNW